MTDRQWDYIMELEGYDAPTEMTREEASAYIDGLLEKKRRKANGPTPRQKMVLMFWDRLDLEDSSKEDVSEWMNDFYSEDFRRKEVWNRWKASRAIPESHEEGGYDSDLPYRIPKGEGWRILKGGAKSSGGCLGLIKGLVIASFALLAMLFLIALISAILGG